MRAADKAAPSGKLGNAPDAAGNIPLSLPITKMYHVDDSFRPRRQCSIGAAERFQEAIQQVLPCRGELIPDGKIHRFHVEGDRPGSKNGWYAFCDDNYPVGLFGCFKRGISETWTCGEKEAMTAEARTRQVERIEAARKLREIEEQKIQAECCQWSSEIWSKSRDAGNDHPYLKLKGVRAYRLKQLRESLLVPLRNMAGEIRGMQFISPDGNKKFKTGTVKRGNYFSIGKPVRNTILLCEGYATGASLHESTGHAVAVAFDAGNLQSVAEVLREKFPNITLVLCADNDKSGVGQEKAAAAAAAISGIVVIPPDTGDDFNDLTKKYGAAAVKAIIEAAIIQTPATVATVATVAVAEWPEPSPLITHQKADPYPLEALPRTIGAAVGEVVDFVQCPVALGACSALAVVSMAAQGLVDIRRAARLEGPISLYVLAIADSGERKTTIDGFFSRPVQQWEAEQAEAAKPELKKFETESRIWEAKKSGKLSAIKESAKKGEDTSSLEKEIANLESEKPVPPKVPRLLFSDATPEALAHRLAHDWPVGCVLSSEAGIVFGGHAMGKDSAMRNMSMLNSLWGAEPFTIDRRSSPSYTVRSARLTMGLAVQSETVRAFLESSKGLARGIGWLARFLIAWPESTQGHRMYKDPPEHWSHLAKFHRRLGALLSLPLPLNEKGELSPVMLELSPDAKAAWVAFHDEVEEELRPGRDMADARDVASKAADNAARLAALFHLFENGTDGTIGLDHMQAAASLVTWHLYEARRFMGEIALPAELDNAVKLNNWLLEYCRLNRAREVTTRTIQQTGPTCIRDKQILHNALDELAEAGRVQVVKDGRRKLVKVNPALFGGENGTTEPNNQL